MSFHNRNDQLHSTKVFDFKDYSPCRMFVQDALKMIESSSKDITQRSCDRFLFVRIMGVVILKHETTSEAEIRESLRWSFFLDDGTGVIDMELHSKHTELLFYSDLPVYHNDGIEHKCPVEGETVDCVGCLDTLVAFQSDLNETKQSKSTNEINGTFSDIHPSSTRIPKIYLHHLTVVTDPNSSTFRGLEIVHNKEGHKDIECMGSDNVKRTKMDEFSPQMRLGPMSAVLGTFYTNENDDLCLNKNYVLRLIKSTGTDGGVNIDDLAIVLECAFNMHLLKTVLQELQVDGEIYQGANGDYLPL